MPVDACWSCGKWECECYKNYPPETEEERQRRIEDENARWNYLNQPPRTGTKRCPGRYGMSCSAIIHIDDPCCTNCMY